MKLHNIEFLRFTFSIIIVYFHILHSNIIKFIGNNSDYLILQKMSDRSGYIVECFFILGGYFLYHSYKNNSDIEWLEFTIKKFFRLWPVLFFSIILGIGFFNYNPITGFVDCFFLRCIGLTLEFKGINWYISPFFWTIIFYFALLKNFNHVKLDIIIAIMVYFGYVLNITFCNGGFGRETIYGFINLGLMRAIAGIGLGYLLASFYEENLKSISLTDDLKRNDLVLLFIVTLFECFSFAYLLGYFLLGFQYKNSFIVVLLFSLLLLCFVSGKGLLGRGLNKKIFSVFGKYAYSTYIMQQISFYILRKTLWKNIDFVNHTVLCLTVSVVFSVLVGCATYHLVEKPSNDLLKYVKFKVKGK